MPKEPTSIANREFKALGLRLSPEQAALELSHLEQLVFLDSAGYHSPTSPSPLSIIAAQPQEVLTGNLKNEKDRSVFHQKLALYENESPDEFPAGAAIGYLEYHSDFTFGFYDQLLIYDHLNKQWFERGELSKNLQANPTHDIQLHSEWHQHSTQQEFISQIKAVKDYIAAGDIYQVNLSQKFSHILTDGTPPLYDFYQTLRQRCPAPMGAYMKLNEIEILSASPETFLRIKGHHIESCPIKGTRPRDTKDEENDQKIIAELTSNIKERAELIMITDLLRNDLGRVCEYGSIETPHLLHHEKLAHVHHLVSTITGQLPDSYSSLDILEQILPGGSITGAPKKRATEIIAELESVPRGPYTGVMGYLGFNKRSQFNIIIRSLIRKENELSYHVGAGIVADSNALDEYEETLQKARGIREAIAAHSS